MAGINFTSPSQPKGANNFAGGLNSTSGPLGLDDTESSDLQNIDFNKFGSIVKRKGYLNLTSSAITGDPDISGLHWYEYNNSGTPTRHMVCVAGDKMYKMDSLDGTWDDITGAVSITAKKHCDFDNFLNEVYVTNDTDAPFQWTGVGDATPMAVPTGLTNARYVKQFNNYLFLAHCTVSLVVHPSRIYWSTIKDTDTWSVLNFIEISKDDGQKITGMKVLADRLVVFKERSIYNVFFTGDPNIPFILPGGGKSPSPVGCVAPWTIQEVENGLVFLSYDGFYYYDGVNAFKISDKITATLDTYTVDRYSQCVSLVQKSKNRYWCSFVTSGQTENDRIIVWDYFNNAFTVYSGMAPSAMCTAYVDGLEELPYFGDYAGFVYQGDTGVDDYPLGVKTAISSYYYTNWKHSGDLIDKKGFPHVTIYYQNANAVLTFAYSYDFEGTDEYTQTFSLATATDVYGTGIYGTAVYAGEGGGVKRRDLTGRGYVVRFKFENNIMSESFQIDGLGMLPHLETYV